MDYEEEDQEEELSYDNPARKLPSPPEPVAPPPPPRKHRYKECLKNHAVGIGAHATDGCGEFMPAGDDGTLESLKCAACSCHRNFHRRADPDTAAGGAAGAAFPLNHHHLLLTQHPHGHFGPSGYLHVGPARAAAPLALPSSSGGEDYYSNPSTAERRKRFRTKFTAEQKDRMLSLAERLDWKIQKQDEEIVQQFCDEVGIKRHVLKVWMHNNKNTQGKKT